MIRQKSFRDNEFHNHNLGHSLMELIDKWKIQDAVETYGIRHWGKGYFGINKAGHVTVHPSKRPDQAIDLMELTDQLLARGIQLPILLRFTDILRHRVGEIHDAFQQAIKESGYQGAYCCVYPIKVNQQRQVVEEILDFGRPFNFGLEAGSKPELLAVMALTNGSDTSLKKSSTSASSTTLAWRPAPSPSCSPCWRRPTAWRRPSSATASRTTSSSK